MRARIISYFLALCLSHKALISSVPHAQAPQAWHAPLSSYIPTEWRDYMLIGTTVYALITSLSLWRAISKQKESIKDELQPELCQQIENNIALSKSGLLYNMAVMQGRINLIESSFDPYKKALINLETKLDTQYQELDKKIDCRIRLVRNEITTAVNLAITELAKKRSQETAPQNTGSIQKSIFTQQLFHSPFFTKNSWYLPSVNGQHKRGLSNFGSLILEK